MKHCFILLLSALTIILTFGGCANTKEPISISTTYFNTFITITIYDSQDTHLLDECVSYLEYYDKIFSLTREDSELHQLNTSYKVNQPATVSEELSLLIHKGMEYTKDSQGEFSILLSPLTSLWNFTASSPSLPDAQELSYAMERISYEDFSINGNEVIFKKKDMGIELGAISKGYIADRLKDFLMSKGVKSALINLGGNILCVGNKPDDSNFTIGIKEPFGEASQLLGTLQIKDKSVVSSGIYERCFTLEGKLYHHLLDTNTGYPIENNIAGVTIISPSSVDGDALSTTCFTLGIEKGLAYLESLPETDGIFVDKEGNLYYTDDFMEKYSFKEMD